MSNEKIVEVLREMARRIKELEKVVAEIGNVPYNDHR